MWRECLESEERPLCRSPKKQTYHLQASRATLVQSAFTNEEGHSSELCILLRSVLCCRYVTWDTTEALARPGVSRQEQGNVKARPWCVSASQGRVLARLESVGRAPRRVTLRCALFFSPAVGKSTAFKQKRPLRISTFFFHLGESAIAGVRP